MRFEPVKISEALGWRLAHGHTLQGKRVAKNTLINDDLVTLFHSNGIEIVDAYMLESGDLDEDTAAEQLARAIAGAGLSVSSPARGRVNIHAISDGLFMPDQKINQINQLSGEIAIACLPPLTPVQKGTLVATLKIIPYAVTENYLTQALAFGESMAVSAFHDFQASLIISDSNLKDKVIGALRGRLAPLKGKLCETVYCDHAREALTTQIKKTQGNLILISGASAISDRKDIVPSAIIAAGGEIIHLGMPVDPGNLLMLAKVGSKTVIGMPGCAKSPAVNGFDWILQRYAAKLSVSAKDIKGMGIGGLLKETNERPAPRAPRASVPSHSTKAIILAAGLSSRSGDTHKLLGTLSGRTVIEHTVLSLIQAGLDDIIVVTGARAESIKAALDGHPVTFVHNPAYESGMANSLSAGVEAIEDTASQALICLGDMPFVAPETYSALIEASQRISEAEIFTPHYKGKKGNPVLWRHTQFHSLKSLAGDTGGKPIIQRNRDSVAEINVEDPGILIDLDTPAALEQFGIRAAAL